MTSNPSVLVLAPVGRDAQIAASILTTNQISSRVCASLKDMLPLLDQVACLVVAEEALSLRHGSKISRHGRIFRSCF